jgi:hypothetical protein
MKRIRLIATTLIAGSAMVWAQEQPPSGWRRVSEPPPPQPETAQPAPPAAVPPAPIAGQDPTQPVERVPVDGMDAPQQQRNDRPPSGAPPYGIPAQLTIKPGTFITVRMSQGLSSDHNQSGDMFTATLQQPIVVDGVIVAQRGQNVVGRVTDAKKAGRVSGTSSLGLQLIGLTLIDGTQANMASLLVNRNGQTSVGTDVAAVGTTTAVGAAIGAAADWGRGAAIGAGAGAAAGLIGVLLTRGRPTVVYPEQMLTFRLDTPVQVNTTHSPFAFRYAGPEDFHAPVQTRVMRPRPGPGPGPGYAPAPYYYGPAPYPVYAPYYPGYWGPGFGVGVVVVRGGGFRRW